MPISKNNLFLSVKDHSVSNELFELWNNDDLDLLITSPQPDEVKLPSYYESDDYISHTDGQRSIFEKIYQIVKNIALKNKLQLINALQPQKGKLLDIGAGTGDFLTVAHKGGWQITGIEPSNKAKSIAQSKGVSFVESTQSLEDFSFDVITMWHVLEHVPNLENQIAELKRLLKPNGTILIAVPNFHSFDAKHYAEFWAAYDVPRHLWHFSKTAIQKLFGKQDLVLHKVLPLKFDAFYVSLLSEKYKYGKMNIVNAFITGMRSNLNAMQTKEYSSHIYVLKNENS